MLTKKGFKVFKSCFHSLNISRVSIFYAFFQFAAFTSLGVICISTFCFILSTFPELQDEEEFVEEEPDEIILTSVDSNITTTPAAVIDLSSLFSGPLFDYTFVKLVLKIIDWITVTYFCVEYVVRFICSPDKKKFFFHVWSY